MNLEKIFSAYDFAKEAHKGQKRKTGEPYITHPIAVAGIALQYNADEDTECACLLHDVVEDTPVTLEKIRKIFGETIAFLVDGVTKEDSGEKTLRKVEEYSKEDSRVIFIKLCDRIHNVSAYISKEWLERYTNSTKKYAEMGRRFNFKELSDVLENTLKELKLKNESR